MIKTCMKSTGNLACFLFAIFCCMLLVKPGYAEEGANTQTTRITLTYRDPQPNSGDVVADKRQTRLERQENNDLFGSLGNEDQNLAANGPDDEIIIELDVTPRIIHVENSDTIRFETGIKEVSKWFGDAVRDDMLQEARNEYAISLIRLRSELKRALSRLEAEELEQAGFLQLDMVNSEFQSVFSHFSLLNDPLEKITLVYTPKDPLPNIRIVKLGAAGTAFEPRNVEYDGPIWVEVYYESEPLDPPKDVNLASIDGPISVPVLRLNKDEFIWRSRAIILKKDEEEDDPLADTCDNWEDVLVGDSVDGNLNLEMRCANDKEPQVASSPPDLTNNVNYPKRPEIENRCFDTQMSDIELFKCSVEQTQRNAKAYSDWVSQMKQQGLLEPGMERNPFGLLNFSLGNEDLLQDSISRDLLGIAQPNLADDDLLPESQIRNSDVEATMNQHTVGEQLPQKNDPLGLELNPDNIRMGDGLLPDLNGITDPKLDNTPITPNSPDTANLGDALSIDTNVRQDDRAALDNPLGILPEDGELRRSDDLLLDLTGIANTPTNLDSILPDVPSDGNNTTSLPFAPRIDEDSLVPQIDGTSNSNNDLTTLPESPEFPELPEAPEPLPPIGVNQNSGAALNAGTPIISSTSRPDLGELEGTPLGELIIRLGRDSPVITQLTKDGVQDGDQLAAKVILDALR